MVRIFAVNVANRLVVKVLKGTQKKKGIHVGLDFSLPTAHGTFFLIEWLSNLMDDAEHCEYVINHIWKKAEGF